MFEQFLAHGPTAFLCLILLGIGAIAGITFIFAWLKGRSCDRVIYHEHGGATDENFRIRDRWYKVDGIAWKVSLASLILSGLMFLGICVF